MVWFLIVVMPHTIWYRNATCLKGFIVDNINARLLVVGSFTFPAFVFLIVKNRFLEVYSYLALPFLLIYIPWPETMPESLTDTSCTRTHVTHANDLCMMWSLDTI
eukprot:981421_1